MCGIPAEEASVSAHAPFCNHSRVDPSPTYNIKKIRIVSGGFNIEEIINQNNFRLTKPKVLALFCSEFIIYV